jgi:Protein of unknown function (DUF2778)
MWTWQQAPHSMIDPSGNVFDSGGYSGKGASKNDPAQQCVVDLGPIPRGTYAMGPAMDHPRLGPVAIPLTPDPHNNMCNRSGFYIHGDKVSDPGNASDGCIILSRSSREAINSSADKILEVVSGAVVAAVDLSLMAAEPPARKRRRRVASAKRGKKRAARRPPKGRNSPTKRSQGAGTAKKKKTRRPAPKSKRHHK